MTDEYDSITCITAAELRAAGLPIDEKIPDCGWVPRNSMDIKLDKPKPGEDGWFTVEGSVTFREPFRWVYFNILLQPGGHNGSEI